MPTKTFSYLENILRFQNKNELQEAADFFRIPVRSSDRKAVMIEKLVNAYRTDILRCLECLPLYELRNLKLLVSMGKGADMLIPEPVPPLFTYMFGLVEDCYDDEEDFGCEDNWGSLYQLFLYDEMYDLIAPHIDTAIRHVEEAGRVEYERFLWGCLTVYGYLSV